VAPRSFSPANRESAQNKQDKEIVKLAGGYRIRERQCTG